MKFCRLITFDIMGTLLDVCAPVGVNYAEVGSKFGLSVNPRHLTKNFKIVWNEMKTKHPNYGVHSGLGWENWWKQLVRETFVYSSNSTLDERKLNDISNHLVNMYSLPDNWRCCDGAIDFIEHAQKKNITMAVLSNFDKRLEQLLEIMNLSKYFRFVIGSYEVGLEKPDDRIFHLVESTARDISELSDLKKCEILHIGDTPDLDYIPAVKNGWNAFLVNQNPEEIIKKFPTIKESNVFKDMHEIKKVFTS